MRLPTCSGPRSLLRPGIVRDVLRSDASPCPICSDIVRATTLGGAWQMKVRSSVTPSTSWRRPVGSGGGFPRCKD